VDFEHHYTEEQEQFRQEVRAWLDVNLSQEVKRPGEPKGLDQATWEQCKSFRRKLGEQGWLTPTGPAEWGGGGLSSGHALVLREELGRKGLRWLLDEGSSSLRATLQQQGTEEQKRGYLSAISRGQATIWHLSREPGAELDADNLGIQASRDGDDYILNGAELFAGRGLGPDYLWTLTLTGPDAPPHQATTTFLVPAGLKGIHIQTPSALAPGEAHRVTFDNVVVPPRCLLGEEGEGWCLVQATPAEAVAEYPSDQDREVDDLFQYARETTRDGVTLSQEPSLQQLLVEAYIDGQLTRLLKTRNAWMAATGRQLTYHTAQAALLEKRAALRLSRLVRDVMGMYALLDHQDPLAPSQGRFELQQRRSLARQNLTGGPEVQAGAVAKHLGLGRRKGEGAPLPRGAPTGVSEAG
jgi:alkylation response protein AidB-like acyl-CoA dehydrogenase